MEGVIAAAAADDDVSADASFYWLVFLASVAGTAFLKWSERRKKQQDKEGEGADGEKKGEGAASAAAPQFTAEQITFQTQYLVVYVCAFFADWLKGPYVYALYQAYGYDEGQIALLFLAGFGTSGLTGPFVGAAADVFGRRRLCVGYFVIYIMSALTKPINSYAVLMVGRILGGAGTSLLYTVFESWMVSEHARRGYPKALLDDTFAKSTLYNGLSAVLAGLIAQAGAAAMGFVGPFMVALLPLALGCFFALTWWRDDSSERAASAGEKSALSGSGGGDNGAGDGDSSTGGDGNDTIMSTIGDGLAAMNKDARIPLLGMAQSLFEGAMYTFVFLWTPALCEGLSKAQIEAIPYGLIFATFMVMIMVGSSLFSFLMGLSGLESIPLLIHGGALALSGITVMTLGWSKAVFFSFVAFEMVCGMFFPTYGVLRAVYIPEKQRSTIMNFFRVPLNLFVVIVLLRKKGMSNSTTFMVCMMSHAASLALWFGFVALNNKTKKAKDAQYSSVSGKDVDGEGDFGDIKDEL